MVGNGGYLMALLMPTPASTLTQIGITQGRWGPLRMRVSAQGRSLGKLDIKMSHVVYCIPFR